MNTLYRIKRGLRERLEAFDYRRLESVTLGWKTDDTDDYQTTLAMYNGR